MLTPTGKGHMTDWIIEKTFMPKPTTVFWDPSFIHPYHTNYMKLVALDEKDNILDTMEVFSIGGGSIREIKNGVVEQSSVEQPYNLEHMTDIVNWCKKNNKKMWEYVFENEDIEQYLDDIYDAMYRCVKRGIKKEGLLPAKLRFKRKAKEMYENRLERKDIKKQIESAKNKIEQIKLDLRIKQQELEINQIADRIVSNYINETELTISTIDNKIKELNSKIEENQNEIAKKYGAAGR